MPSPIMGFKTPLQALAAMPPIRKVTGAMIQQTGSTMLLWMSPSSSLRCSIIHPILLFKGRGGGNMRRKRLGEDICKLIFGGDGEKLKSTMEKMITDKMTINLDVFSPFMKDIIVSI
ncbi:hypothetical protein CK203_073279 [Vitis vinifera]|uniref:Uncharacterized protein n=1 Tax=Vitis vinifera TaxID=29760 RepID=A0A438ENM7_VITVI|nr:hypothetical protein CK203_073279 [Vitis vinifera]